MLKIIYGKSRSGKTTYIFNHIKEKYDNNLKENIKSYLIVPEQFSLTAEEKLTKFLGKGGLFNVEVLTLKRMAYYVFNELGLNIDNISEVGKKIIIYNILNNNKFKLFNLASKGNIDNILDIFLEFDRYGVTTDVLNSVNVEDERLKDKINDLSSIYEQYTDAIQAKGKNYTNELEILNQYLDKSKIMNNCYIYIDEFYGFTKQEYEIILKLAINNNIYISFCIDDTKKSDNPLDIYSQNKAEYIKFIDMCNQNDIRYEQIKVQSEYVSRQNAEIIHLQDNIFAYPYTNYKSATSAINICSCVNPYVEVENVASMICKDIKNGYRYSDIIIITRDLEKYSDLFWAIFKKYNIPYFLDSKIDISNNQIAILIFSILDIIVENFSYQSVFAYLKTGFLDVDIDDIHQMENYAIKWGIKGYKWNEDFRYDYDVENEERKQQIDLLNNIRKQVIQPLYELRKDVLQCTLAKQIVERIYQFLTNVGIEQNIQNKIKFFEENNLIQLQKEYTDIWSYYIEVFEQLVLSIGDRQINISEFKKLLEIGFTNTQKSFVPLYKDCVLIGDIERTRSNEIKCIYFIGTQNDKFPITYPTEGLLTDNDRIFLNQNEIQLAKTSSQNIVLDQFSIYKIITMCLEKITFSYVFNDLNGTSYRPSFLINKIKKMFNIKEVIVDETYLKDRCVYLPSIDFMNVFDGNIELLNWYKNNKRELYDKYIQICNFENSMNINLDDEVVSNIYTNELKTSISRIEEYVRCPYGFYLKYILKIKQKEVYQVKSLDIGNFNHQVLEKFFEYIIQNNIDIKILDNERTNEIVDKIIDDMFENINIQAIKYAKDFTVLKLKLRKILKRAVWVLVLQIKNSSFRPIGTEVEFGERGEYHEIIVDLDNGKKVKLRGKIDRIDVADTKDGSYVRIIDYKSSSKTIDVSDIYSGLNIQLISYLDAVTQKDDSIIPGGLLYFKIDDPIIRTDGDISKEEIEKKIISQMKLDGLILNDKTLITHMDNNIDKSSDLVNIKLNKDGLSSNNNAIDLNEFKKLQQEAKNVLKKISIKILDGEIPVLPYWKDKNRNGCRYCSYNSVCKFNAKNEQCRYNIIRKV